MLEFNNCTLDTGSSGYVASNLVPMLCEHGKVIGIDLIESKFTDIVCDIADVKKHLSKFDKVPLTVVNLAAARFDFGAKATEYFAKNVSSHSELLKGLESLNVKTFIHISSVAAIDGQNISYSNDLNCDDAYRCTKYLQEKLVIDWCQGHGVDLTILYPSAVFSKGPRSDTNIGKLQLIARLLPFVPAINVIKSLTYLPNFSRFIVASVNNEIPSGKYLTIEKPLMTVSQIMQRISGRPIRLVRVPFLQRILIIISNFFYLLGFFGKIDFKLTPNRVVKLFSDTSYDYLSDKNIDITAYTIRNKVPLTDLLQNFKD